ncbi:AIDA repeat-containing protein [Caulobacter sp. S45]|uniref:beta strand repeat-containing protein n=1 Tax=Caulobacter sp. S45 TaxID=1641861 RepID=UPI001575243F|nr:AIDA repeat-containing protein [Caulobacter sp. S45]
METLNNPDSYSQGIYVSSGGLAVRTTVAGGGSLEVEAGGVASTTTIQQAGLLYVDGGGSIFGATISSGGLLSGAATASGVVTDYAGGVDSGTTFTSGSYDFFYAGATQNAVTVSSAATLELADLVVSAGSPLTIGPVLSAQTISGASLVAGAKVTALSATVLAGGVLTVAPGGFAYDTTVSSGGIEVISAGASAAGADVLFGGVLSGSGSIRSVVDDAGIVSGVTVASGGLLDVLAGGEAGGLKVASGATVSVAAGATLQIGNLGSTTVYAGGVISGPGDLQGLVRTSGVVEDVTVGVGADGQLDVLSGGSASGVTVGVEGGMLLESGGTASDTVVTSGGVLSAATGGILTDVTLTSGALLSGRGVASGLIEVGPGATIDNLTIASGATEAFYAGVSSPAAQAGVTIASGATLELDHDVVSTAFSIGSVTSRRVVSGATLSVGADLATQSAQIVAGGLEIVTSGGTATSTTVSSGGDLRLSAGGAANAVTVLMGGVLSGAGTVQGAISDNGLVSGVSVDGLLTVSSGASAEALFIDAGGAVDVLAQGSATSTTVLAGGVLSAAAGAVTNGLLTVSSGGTAESAVLTSGATEQLYAGGIDSGVKISAGAVLELVSAQVAASTPLTVGPRTSNSTVDGATLSSGARLVTVAANVVSGGIETVVSGGQASATTVSSGGVERLSSGGYAEGATVLAGGVLSGAGVVAQTISDAGQVNGVAVGAGAVLDVLSGGSISGLTLRAGSTVSGTPGGSAHGRIVVESGSILDGQIGFTSGATDLDYAGSVESGVRVSGGAVLELVGEVISGGTVSAGLYSTPKTVSGIAVLSGADLQTLSTTIVDSGAELVTSGGSIVSTLVSSGGVLSAAAGGYVSGLVVLSGGEALGAGTLKGMTTDAGKVSGLVLGAGADLDVTAGGSANGIDVSSGTVLSAASGAILYDVREAVGGLVVDNGGLVYDQAGTSILDGSLSGSGSITEESTGVLRLSAIAAGYDGALTIAGGTVDIALKGGLGTGSVAFEAATASATVEIETADQPKSGSTLANMLVDFDGANDTLDLRGLAFVKGASATVSDSTLTFTDGAYTAKFDLVGAVAGSYSAVSDGAGGTKIIPIANGSDAIIHAAAAFGGDKGSLGATSGAGAALSAQSLGFRPSSVIRHGGQNLPA